MLLRSVQRISFTTTYIHIIHLYIGVNLVPPILKWYVYKDYNDK